MKSIIKFSYSLSSLVACTWNPLYLLVRSWWLLLQFWYWENDKSLLLPKGSSDSVIVTEDLWLNPFKTLFHWIEQRKEMRYLEAHQIRPLDRIRDTTPSIFESAGGDWIYFKMSTIQNDILIVKGQNYPLHFFGDLLLPQLMTDSRYWILVRPIRKIKMPKTLELMNIPRFSVVVSTFYWHGNFLCIPIQN